MRILTSSSAVFSLVLFASSAASFAADPITPLTGEDLRSLAVARQAVRRPVERQYYKPTQRYFGKDYAIIYGYTPVERNVKDLNDGAEIPNLSSSQVARLGGGENARLVVFEREAAPRSQAPAAGAKPATPEEAAPAPAKAAPAPAKAAPAKPAPAGAQAPK